MKKIRTQEKLEGTLENMLSEHLDCFLLVGYAVDGKGVVCRMVETDKDRDSLLVAVSNLAEELNDAYYSEGVGCRMDEED